MAYQQEEASSLEHIHASEVYPKKSLVTEDKSLQIPFPVLFGESVEFLGQTSDGIIALSNFRVFIRNKDSFVNIPLGLVESIECRDIFFLHIYSKDARSLRCTFPTNESCLEWFRRLATAAATPRRYEDIFALTYRAWCVDTTPASQHDLDMCYQLCQPDVFSYSFGKEVERMNFDLKTAWRISYINEKHELCPSYPALHIVPVHFNDEDLQSVASFRSSKRFPTVVWRHRRNGAVIARCSQPEVGWLGWRNDEDEKLLKAIATACAIDSGGGGIGGATSDQTKDNGHTTEQPTILNGEADGSPSPDTAIPLPPPPPPPPPPRKLLIIDARSYSSAFANRAKGGGCECPEYYPNCEIQFMSLANIHAIRKSFHALRALCAGCPDQANWLSSLENTKWLQHISGLMRSAVVVVNAIEKEQRPVLVHCSDGWDRTPQICALAELFLDPYYRTIQGFQVLVEREWLELGHKFGDRCGHGVNSDDVNERCPVFLQWLDCVYQAHRQLPCAFEFNVAFLIKLVQHTYSCLFGTFLCNNAQERAAIRNRTCSVWSLLRANNKKFKNYMFTPDLDQVLRPSCSTRNLHLWTDLYLSNSSPMAESVEVGAPINLSDDDSSVDSGKQAPLTKTRSCDDIVAALEHTTNMTRRLSDPNISVDHHDPSYLLNMATLDTEDTPPMSDGPSNRESFESAESGEESHGDCHDPRLQLQNGDTMSFKNQASFTNADDASTEKGLSNGGEEEEAEVICKEIITSVIDEHVGVEKTEDRESVKNVNGNVGLVMNGLTNGHADEGSQTDGLLNGTTQPLVNGNKELVVITSEPGASADGVGQTKPIDGSTDTLTEDVIYSELNGHDHTHMRTRTSSDCRSINLDNHELGGRKVSETRISNSSLDRLKNLERSSTVSTSTSDISDSHVVYKGKVNGINGHKLDNVLLSLNVQVPQNVTVSKLSCHCEAALCNAGSKASGSSVESGTSTPLFSTPQYSRTPSSTCPNTPSTDKTSDPFLLKWLSVLSRHLDCDGLTSFPDAAQLRLQQQEMEHQAKIDVLERQLKAATIALYQYASGCNGAGGRYVTDNKDDLLSLPDSNGSGGEVQSLGSKADSDVSWEHVEEKDAKMTLWVPDHAVTHCAGCDHEFWIVRRKHHCRNCGRVYCGECTNFFTPIPQQQLPEPVRVCRSCYLGISKQATCTSSPASDYDKPIAAAASSD